jgi:hypothetical protein
MLALSDYVSRTVQEHSKLKSFKEKVQVQIWTRSDPKLWIRTFYFKIFRFECSCTVLLTQSERANIALQNVYSKNSLVFEMIEWPMILWAGSENPVLLPIWQKQRERNAQIYTPGVAQRSETR